MKNCMTCNAECEESAIICLKCGSIADQPVIENTNTEDDWVGGEMVMPEATPDRQKFNLFALKGELFDTCHGRKTYILGHLLMVALLIPTLGILFAIKSDVLTVVGALIVTVIMLIFFVKSIALTLGRYRDMGIQSGFARFLALVALYIPITSLIAALALMFVPRDCFASESAKTLAV
jgi:uncharacterized membrane protein YhaH (DUF805 family)